MLIDLSLLETGKKAFYNYHNLGSMIILALFAVLFMVFYENREEKPVEQRLRRLTVWSMAVLLAPGTSDFLKYNLPQGVSFFDAIPVMFLAAYCATLIAASTRSRLQKIGVTGILLILVLCAGPEPLLFKTENVEKHASFSKCSNEMVELKDYIEEETVIMPFELGTKINEVDGITNLVYGVNLIDDKSPSVMADVGRANSCTYVVFERPDEKKLTIKEVNKTMEERYYRYTASFGDYLVYIDTPELYPE